MSIRTTSLSLFLCLSAFSLQPPGACTVNATKATNILTSLIIWSTCDKYRASQAYHQDRMRSTSASPPDKICLSYTHDRDYTSHLPAPGRQDALARGVMLDVVERRHAQYQRPVQDLSKPIAEINEVPSVCLFLDGDGCAAEAKHSAFNALAELATEIRGRAEAAGKEPPLLFFVGAQPVGAVPQVRHICGVSGSPAIAILDVDKGCRYRLPEGVDITPASLRELVESFLEGSLDKEPLAS
eukprot:TRINITY_DN40431_c0_g1_i4.p1 TRINITY_DN40431_c0_g1~~TRINITY_DN40431_c0_g1_i4.p1  ORF type:complete len:241 (+),score=39.33 TRINITY_DN40431_c0_g1_i4:48-770(+)